MDSWELAFLRRVAYGLLGAALLYPEKTTVVGLAQSADHLHRDADASAEMAFHVSWQAFICSARTLTPDHLSALQNEYLGLFGVGAYPEPISLLESAYLDPSGQASGQLMADLESDYSLAGLAVSGSDCAAPDHAGVEMEFMSVLCGQELEAVENGDAKEVLETIRRQREFLDGHLSLWLPLLSQAVAVRSEPDFYAVTLRAARALVVHDVDYLQIWGEHLAVQL